MRHYDITKSTNGLSTVMVTESSNSFGDQILELKVLIDNSYYETVKTNLEHEGSHMHAINWALQSMQLLFLDWVNNFLTVPRFAEYYQISEEAALVVINEGREIHESLVKQIKSKKDKK